MFFKNQNKFVQKLNPGDEIMDGWGITPTFIFQGNDLQSNATLPLSREKFLLSKNLAEKVFVYF